MSRSEPLMRVSAIITDENDTSTYLDDASALKSIITGDPFQINRKFKDPRALRFRGFMTQCVNAYPRLRDRSESMYRRLLVVPFNKRFEGHERKYIKNDYLYRQDVLEYVLFHVLHDMDYYELSTPEVCVAALNEYRMVNDPVRDFCEDILPQASWDLLPWTFLHDLYKCWMVRRQPQSRAESLRAFKSRVLSIIDDYPEWSDSVSSVRPGKRMDSPELLILEYDVTEWMNKDYKGQDRTKLAMVEPKAFYRGLVRDPSVASALAVDAAEGVGVTPDGNE
ncbi:MAG: primase-like DNA-binding domain-containing protein [[Clostridium] innocuum]